jgi:hypothetical protein
MSSDTGLLSQWNQRHIIQYPVGPSSIFEHRCSESSCYNLQQTYCPSNLNCWARTGLCVDHDQGFHESWRRRDVIASGAGTNIVRSVVLVNSPKLAPTCLQFRRSAGCASLRGSPSPTNGFESLVCPDTRVQLLLLPAAEEIMNGR